MKNWIITILLLASFSDAIAQCYNCQKVDSINYATGVDKAGNRMITGAIDVNWVLTNAPNNANIATPRRPYIVSQKSGWGSQTTNTLATISGKGKWISPFSSSNTTVGNPSPMLPYTFTYTFCIYQADTFNFKGLINADDWAELNVDGIHTLFTTPGLCYNVYAYDQSVYLTPGTHTINIDLRDIYGVAMGVNCIGTITAKNGLNLGAPPSTITGTSSIDTSLCTNDTLILKPKQANTQATYQWSNNSTDNHITVYKTGTYWVMITDTVGCTISIDSFNVQSKNTVSTNNIDTIICRNGMLTLRSSLQLPNTTYQWSNNSTTGSINISGEGNYWVTAVDSLTCTTNIDSFNISPIDVTAKIINKDTVICSGDSILISAIVTPSSATIVWSNGDTSLNTLVSAEGRLTFTAEHSGCKVEDHVSIDHYPNIFIDLGEDREICIGDVLTLPMLVTSELSDTYLWQDGSTKRKYSVTKAGKYTVHVSGFCNTVSDSVTITERNCHIFFPSVFSPNSDGRNDIARMVGDISSLSNYELHIFNRWGEEVYNNNDIHTGWDGQYKGQPSAQGTYNYYIKFKYLGSDQIMKGTLTLLR